MMAETAFYYQNVSYRAAQRTLALNNVTPERKACDHCHLHMLCRIDEQGGVDEPDEVLE